MPSLRIAMLAPPWIAVPPPGYGGIEVVVDLLCRELTRRGHHVTLFAAPGSCTAATEIVSVLDGPRPNDIQKCLYESDHVAAVFDRIEAENHAGRGFDLVHDHSGFAAVAFANRLRTPLLHTLHGPFTDDTWAFYDRHAHKAWALAISSYQAERAPAGLRIVGIAPNPLVAGDFPLVAEKDDYVLWMGRFNPDKGPHRAIAAADRAGVNLVLAGPVHPGQEEYFEREIAPDVDGRRVRYVGEVGGARKVDLLARARGFLMPIRWPEPFGLVMTEAMACGTPVIAYAEGSVPDIVADGRTGFVVDGEEEMARAIGRLQEIDPADCRRWVEERFDVRPATDLTVRAYRAVLEESRAASGPRMAARLGPASRAGRARLARLDQGRLGVADHNGHRPVAVDDGDAVRGRP